MENINYRSKKNYLLLLRKLLLSLAILSSESTAHFTIPGLVSFLFVGFNLFKSRTLCHLYSQDSSACLNLSLLAEHNGTQHVTHPLVVDVCLVSFNILKHSIHLTPFLLYDREFVCTYSFLNPIFLASPGCWYKVDIFLFYG